MASVTPTSLLRSVLDQTAYNDKSPSHVTLASPSIERAYDSTTDMTPMKRMVEQRRADGMYVCMYVCMGSMLVILV